MHYENSFAVTIQHHDIAVCAAYSVNKVSFDVCIKYADDGVFGFCVRAAGLVGNGITDFAFVFVFVVEIIYAIG